jgi:hypothetical protein
LSTKDYSTAQEKRVAKGRGWRTFNSGATPFDKGDVEWQDALIECKTRTTARESITIKKDWITKLREEAIIRGKPYYFLFFGFGDGGQEYYIVPLMDLEQLYDDSHILERIKEELLGGNVRESIGDDSTTATLKRIVRGD